MKYLLDTHVLLWFLLDERQHFSKRSLDLLLNEDNILYFSTASIWEIAIKSSLQKPDFPYDPQLIANELIEQGFIEQPISLKHTFALPKLPFLHNNPFDRLLICQAEQENLQFLTADQKILQYQKSFIWDIRT
ncbi:hypothetical protein BMT54_03910 [Pasteurellaceae bacterium 15-036681]|nr:hypothetical protein BMT54_03910 [Pasteurellaceae bacterium 15-036681]